MLEKADGRNVPLKFHPSVAESQYCETPSNTAKLRSETDFRNLAKVLDFAVGMCSSAYALA